MDTGCSLEQKISHNLKQQETDREELERVNNEKAYDWLDWPKLLKALTRLGTDKKLNKEVQQMVGQQRSMINTSKSRKMTLIRQVLRESLFRTVIDETIW